MTLGTVRKEYILRTYAGWARTTTRSETVVKKARVYIKKHRTDLEGDVNEIPEQFLLSYVLDGDWEKFWIWVYDVDPEGRERDVRERNIRASDGSWTFREKK